MKLSNLIPNPSNPREIHKRKFEQLKANIERSSKFMKYNRIKYDKDNFIVAGNMRHKALIELGYKDIPDEWTVCVDDLTPEEIEELIIIDNTHAGRFNWDMMANNYDQGTLETWGVDIPGVDYDLDPVELPDGEKPSHQLSYTFSDHQTAVVKASIELVKSWDEFNEMDTKGNDNVNGNALYYIVSKWAEQNIKKKALDK